MRIKKNKHSKINKRRLMSGVFWVPLALSLAACSGGGVSDGVAASATGHEMPEVVAAASAANVTTVPLVLAQKMNATSITPDAETDRFIVKYKNGTNERRGTVTVQSRLDRFASAFPARARHNRRLGIGSDIITTDRKLNAKETQAFMRAIASDPDVEYVEPDVIITMTSVPNDPLYSQQWGMLSNLDVGETSAGIRAADAWNVSTGAGITMAVIDNGLTSHSDLNANVLPAGFDFTWLGPTGGANPGVARGCELSYHGTHVGGIMAGIADNGVGIAGVAPSAKLISARVMSECGRGFLSSASDALVWASGGEVPGLPVASKPASVLNLSFGATGQCYKTMQDSVDYATGRGAVVVAAAGNDNTDASNNVPANCRGVIAVANTQRDGSRSGSSNYGPIVDVAAPGTDILSTYNNGMYSLGSESYFSASGTSMSAPMVSGVVALVQSAAPKALSAAEIRTLITQHAQPFPTRPDQYIGTGILDAAATVKAAKSGLIPAAADFTCAQSSVGMLLTCTDLSTARGSTSIKSREWNFGVANQPDIVSTQSTNPSNDYEFPGTYVVTLTITDNTGGVSRTSRPVMVVAPATIDWEIDSNEVISAKANQRQYFRIKIPTGSTYLRAILSHHSSLSTSTFYLKAGSPSTIKPTCMKPEGTMGVGCQVSNPMAGDWYIIIDPLTDLNEDWLYATLH